MAQDERYKEGSSGKKNVSTKEREKKSKEKPPSKVIIRRLPPTMTEETFLEQIDPMPDNDYFYYVKGEQHVGVPTFSRAYINFVNQEDIFTFQEKFDGYVFLDEKGTEYTALVEFAPYQKTPRHVEPGGKEDKCNTIDTDPHFLEFLKKLEEPEEFILQSAESYLEQLELKEWEMKANGHTKTTPLVEFIQQRRVDREKYREEKKEERRRKDIEKKKQKDLERLKKRENKRDEKKQDKQGANKGKREEDRQPNPIKVLKNTEREAIEKPDVVDSGAVTKKPKEPSRTKQERFKEKPVREKSKPKPTGDKKPNDADETKQEAHSPPRKPADRPSSSAAAEISPEVGSKGEEERSSKKRSEGETERERKIRNKDRPAIQIYRPGAKRINKPEEASSSDAAGVKREVKTRTFSRSSAKE